MAPAAHTDVSAGKQNSRNILVPQCYKSYVQGGQYECENVIWT